MAGSDFMTPPTTIFPASLSCHFSHRFFFFYFGRAKHHFQLFCKHSRCWAGKFIRTLATGPICRLLATRTRKGPRGRLSHAERCSWFAEFLSSQGGGVGGNEGANFISVHYSAVMERLLNNGTQLELRIVAGAHSGGTRDSPLFAKEGWVIGC